MWKPNTAQLDVVTGIGCSLRSRLSGRQMAQRSCGTGNLHPNFRQTFNENLRPISCISAGSNCQADLGMSWLPDALSCGVFSWWRGRYGGRCIHREKSWICPANSRIRFSLVTK
jgi:hypothetical protein